VGLVRRGCSTTGEERARRLPPSHVPTNAAATRHKTATQQSTRRAFVSNPHLEAHDRFLLDMSPVDSMDTVVVVGKHRLCVSQRVCYRSFLEFCQQ